MGEMRVRAALHRGPVERRGAHYMGAALFRTARFVALAHGGQTLATTELVTSCPPEGLGGITFRDLGRQRLRDVREPERVWQVEADGLQTAFPPLRSAETRLDGLPRSRTSFVGREAELARVVGLLASERLVALTGPGGIGKTRLGTEAAHVALREHAERFADGGMLVDLTAARVPADVPGVIAGALAVRPNDGETVEAALGRWLEGRRLLLVIDNCEHVIEMAPLVGRLLDRATDLVVLATSRERLRLRDERVIEVPPLEVADRSGPAGAIRLFCDRAGIEAAGLSGADAAVVADLCERLDGLPLAIELAAARLPTGLVPGGLAPLGDRLSSLRHGPRDLPERHRALAGAIDWSVDLLDVPERTLFARLGVFARGWTAETAEEVCGPLPGQGTVADALASLVEKSLVRGPRGDERAPRYRMLETIREAAVLRLEASGEMTAVRDRHLAWAVAFMEAAAKGRWGSEPTAWIARVDDEAAGMDSAVSHALDSADDLALVRIVGHAGFLPELVSVQPVMVRTWAAHVEGRLAVTSVAIPDLVLARYRLTSAILTYYDGDHASALAILTRSRDVLRQLAPSTELGETLLLEAEVTTDVAPDDPRREEALLLGLRVIDDAERAYRAAGDGFGVGSAANSRAIVLSDLGRTEEALAEFERAIATTEREVPGADMNAVIISLAIVELQAGMIERATATIRRCLEWRDATGVPDPWIDAFTLLSIAGIAVERSDFATAGRLVGVALQLQERSGQRTRAWDAILAQTRVALDSASGGLAEGLIALGATMTPDEAFELASAIVGMGRPAAV
jgi:predicted ATPase